jgi:hypothetical protein
MEDEKKKMKIMKNRKAEIRKMEITKIRNEIASTANMIDYSQ